MEFIYTAIGEKGEKTEGRLAADDRFALAKELRSRGQIPVTIHTARARRAGAIALGRMFSSVSLHEKIVLFSNLSGMLSAGLPLYRALDVQRRQSKNSALVKVLEGVLASINKGGTLSSAFEAYPDVFPPLASSMVRAGEESGNLSGALKEIAVSMDKIFVLERKVKGALAYPAVIISAILLVGVLMLVFVVPTLTKIFKDFGTALPASTQFVIRISDAIASHPLRLTAGIIFGILFLWYFFSSPSMRKASDTLALAVPGIGKIVREVNTARTARTLSSMLASGVEMTRSISIARDVVQNTYYKVALEKANAAVQRGEVLSSVLKAYPNLYPTMAGEMVSVGEETGKLADMLAQVASYYEDEVDSETKTLSTVIEPVLMVIIGGAVGFFAISMISPMYGLVNSLT